MKRLSLYAIAFLLCCIKMSAVPALYKPIKIMQRDSTFVEVYMHGDEFCHFYFTNDNIPVAMGDDGSVYHVKLENGELKLSSILVHEKNDRNVEEIQFVNDNIKSVKEFLSADWTEKIEKANTERFSRHYAKSKTRAVGVPTEYKGDKKGVVILVNFANKEMSVSNADKVFDRMFNEVGYNENGALGSVHDYFYDQSYGQFNLTFDVVGPVKVSNNYGYYGSNGTGLNGKDLYVGEMIVEACRLADDYVDFSDYDWDGDGEVDQVFVIYAGYGEASGGAKNTIWPHESQLKYHDCGTVSLDGVKINTYACSCELTGGSGATLNGMGTACHEFSHCLGLPDLYDTTYSGGFGMSYWDLMSSGSYSGPHGYGEVPTGYSAYERYFAGWLKLTELSQPCVINSMPAIGDQPVAYAIYNDNHRDEFFVLENRQNTKWFTYVDQYKDIHGLLVSHVDYNENSWRNNSINILPKHQRFTVIPADKSYGEVVSVDGRSYYIVTENELSGDLFPGRENITELTNDTHNGTVGLLFNANTDGTYNMNKPITKIKEKDGLISFYFMGGIYVPVPVVAEASEITKESFVANWEAVDEADSYSVELSIMREQGNPNDNLLLGENFAKFKTGSDTADGYTDLAGQLDFYMQNRGWEGKKVFTSQFGIKLGTTSSEGYLLTPLMSIDNSNLTVKLTAQTVSSTDADIQLIIMRPTGSIVETKAYKLNAEQKQLVVNFEDIEDKNIKIKIISSDRIYLSEIFFYAGVYNESDFEDTSEGSMAGEKIALFENIEGTMLQITDLTENIYRYRVKAHLGDAESEWSQYVYVDLLNSSDIIEIGQSNNSTIDGIYNINGIKVGHVSHHGFYIVRNANGTVKKVIIK